MSARGTYTKKSLAREALLKSISVRTGAGLDLVSPICVYDLCDRLGVRVRFIDISMEGLYIQAEGDAEATILVSALRPLPRRVYTCAHELAHHVFEHGSSLDRLLAEVERGGFIPKEFLADAFAGFLLMPALGVRQAFAKRGWDALTAGASEFYVVACSFGVGYSTLVNHVAYGLQIISRQRATTLLKTTPKKIRHVLLGRETPDPLVVVDNHVVKKTVDVEVTNHILLPSGVEIENDVLIVEEDLPNGRLFRASRPGIARAYHPDGTWAVFVRASRFQYVGLSRYRHLEDVGDGGEHANE